MSTIEQARSRRAAAMDVRRRREATHLSGPDVIDHCKKCGGPIFAQSPNVKNLAGRHIDNTPRKAHVKCPGGER